MMRFTKQTGRHLRRPYLPYWRLPTRGEEIGSYTGIGNELFSDENHIMAICYRQIDQDMSFWTGAGGHETSRRRANTDSPGG